MVKLTVHLLDAGQTKLYIETEAGARRILDASFPEARGDTLLEKVDAINQQGFAEVAVEPYHGHPDQDKLDPDYHQRNQDDYEDPWLREE